MAPFSTSMHCQLGDLLSTVQTCDCLLVCSFPCLFVRFLVCLYWPQCKIIMDKSEKDPNNLTFTA